VKNFFFKILCYSPSFLKILYLKNKGKIGKNFKIGRGSIIVADKIDIGDNVSISNNVIVRTKDLKLFNRVDIRNNVNVYANKLISIGDDSLIDHHVTIGGMQSVYSELQIGKRVSIFEYSYINTSRRVILGDDVGIGGYCQIFTHGTWQNVLQGYPYSFGNVEIKANAWLPWRVFVMPGVTIGRNVTIGSSSLISKDAPDDTFFGGMPAKVLKQKDEYVRKMSSIDVFNQIGEILDEFVIHQNHFFSSNYQKKSTGDEIMISQNDIIKAVFSNNKNISVDNNVLLLSYFTTDSLTHNQLDLLNNICYSQTIPIGIQLKSYLTLYGIKLETLNAPI
jgi:acetyltransferase-like isoleucine patch superfamily enzyme